MKKTMVAATSLAATAALGLPAHADNATLDGGKRSSVVLHGHLQGQTVLRAGPAPATYEQALSTTKLLLSLPKGKTLGSLVVHVESALTNAGFNARLLNAKGDYMGGAGGFQMVGYPGGRSQSELSWTVNGLRPGTYSLELSTVGGVADYTETLSWAADTK